MPNYKNRLYGKLGIAEIVWLLRNRLRSKSYIFLYLGVRAEHRGLGNALTQKMIENVSKRRASAIGAFVKKCKVTGSYAQERINNVCEYVLLQKQVN